MSEIAISVDLTIPPDDLVREVIELIEDAGCTLDDDARAEVREWVLASGFQRVSRVEVSIVE